MNFFTKFFNLLLCYFFILQTLQAQENIIPEIKGPKQTGYTLYGRASFYAEKFHGRQTANGETFSKEKFTAACNVLPLGTWIQVTNLKNGKIAVVKTNDRLHAKNIRLIDLSHAAAEKLGFINAGLTKVKIIVLDQSLYNKGRPKRQRR